MRVLGDTHFHAQLELNRRKQLRYSRTATGFSSPKWVECPTCGSYKGDSCTGLEPVEQQWESLDGESRENYHEERIDRNASRLSSLPTYATPIETPCCGSTVWLVWRAAYDKLEWHGVPCTECEKTYAIERYASDLVEQRIAVDRMNPEHVEMCCWALENAPPLCTPPSPDTSTS